MLPPDRNYTATKDSTLTTFSHHQEGQDTIFSSRKQHLLDVVCQISDGSKRKEVNMLISKFDEETLKAW
jgi:hypothetical protein